MRIRYSRAVTFLIIFSLFATFSSGCGQKGDLTRPSAVKTKTSTPTDSKKVQAH
jgi:predicted small lipoprotein YifL